MDKWIWRPLASDTDSPALTIGNMRTSILGYKHKATEPVCIKHPDTGELITNPKNLKSYHNLKILTKKNGTGTGRNIVEKKKKLHTDIMSSDIKDTDQPDVEIVMDPGILVPRKYLSGQKIVGKVTTLNRNIDYNLR